VFAAMAVWIGWSLLQLPPLAGKSVEGAGTFAQVLAGLGAAIYSVSALRYAVIYRRRITLLPFSVITCFTLLAESMFGSALVGERTWHASWWEWHLLIVTAYGVVLYAAHHQWREERFRQLYLSTTRERTETVSVLFADLAGFTTFAEQSPQADVAAMLSAYYGLATPLISQRFGGEVEKFMGDAIMATFNTRGDQPDHAVRAASAAVELQYEMRILAADHLDWPRLRVGVALTARCSVMVWWFGWPPSGSAPASGRECATSPPRHLTRRRRWLSEGKPGRASQPCGGLGWKRRQPPNIACCAASRRAARTTCPLRV